MADLNYWLWLTSRKRMDAGKILAVLDYFVTPERAYYADGEEYGQLPGGPGAWSGLLDKGMDLPDRILADCDRLGDRKSVV